MITEMYEHKPGSRLLKKHKSQKFQAEILFGWVQVSDGVNTVNWE